MEAVLKIEGLTKNYPEFCLGHVSFSVPKGSIVGLIGENGAGKTTTINLLLDFVQDEENGVLFSTHITSDLSKYILQ